MALRSNRSVHWRWCNHSMMEMRSLGSCQGLVWAAILAGAQAAWYELIAELCHDRPTKGDTLLQISMGSWWLRLGGKPHFKRWGMSRTGTLRSGCQVGQVPNGKSYKSRGSGWKRHQTTIEPTGHLLPLSKNLPCSFLLFLPNPCYP